MGQKSLSIDLIITDAGTQMRSGTRLETVKEYAAMFDGTKWPFDNPLIVFTDGKSHWLADGFHRYEAAQMVSRGSVSCELKKGSLEDAQDFALSANARHGLRRSNEDKRHAVEIALSMERWADKSNRMIADACGVSEQLVRSIRKDSTALKSQLNETSNEKPTKRTGKDGKKRTISKPVTQREPGDESEPDGEDPAVTDKAGRSVPRKLLEHQGLSVALASAARQIDPLIRELDRLSDLDGGEFLDSQGVGIELKKIKGLVRDSGYFTHCPRCKGKKGCELCEGVGYMPIRHKGYMTKEEKDLCS